MNKTTRAITVSELKSMVELARTGFELNGVRHRPHPKAEAIMILQFNLGLRLGDLLALKLSDIVRDGDRYRLNIVEEKTGRRREFTVPERVMNYIQSYALTYGISPDSRLFEITSRSVQRYIKCIADKLGYQAIGSHSARKGYATEIYNNNGKDIMLVKQLLQHSSASTTQRYIKLSTEYVERAIDEHVNLVD